MAATVAERYEDPVRLLTRACLKSAGQPAPGLRTNSLCWRASSWLHPKPGDRDNVRHLPSNAAELRRFCDLTRFRATWNRAIHLYAHPGRTWSAPVTGGQSVERP